VKYLKKFSLLEGFPSSGKNKDNKLKDALYTTPAGKDLRAVANVRELGPSPTHLGEWYATFYTHIGNRGFVAVEPVTRDGQLFWNYGDRYRFDSDTVRNWRMFTTAEDCLRGLWMMLVLYLCSQIFPDTLIRREHVKLIRSNIKLFEGHAYDVEDLKFLITNLKDILSSSFSPNVAWVLSQKFPRIWKTLSDNPGVSTLADLGDLGF
jgi:hypothetical protein